MKLHRVIAALIARQARELSRQAAKTNLPQAYEASLNRLRTSAQR